MKRAGGAAGPERDEARSTGLPELYENKSGGVRLMKSSM
jgi:hypothetical protein